MKKQALVRVALADDNIIMRKGLVSLMSSVGNYKAEIEADNGKDLIKKLEQAKVLPDLCIMEITMQHINGYQALKIIKERWPSVKVLIFTAINNEYSVNKLLQDGASGYLLKTCSPKEFEKAVASIAETGYYYSRTVTKKLVKAIKSKEIVPAKITEKEKRFLAYCCTDLTYEDIAGRCKLSRRTIESTRDRLFVKLSIESRVGLAKFAMQTGIVEV
ncbi:MAG: response regulator transcription factor [Bacteroidetes bacterium]|nr:response regulator transcription factor [Bacteroidota bacterium]